MQLARQELQGIVAKSLSLWERRDGDFVPEPPTDPQVEKKIESRLKQWCDIVAEGDSERFEKRLAFDGLNVETARSLLGNGTVSVASELPSWATLLNEVLACTADFPHAELDAELVEKYRFLDKSTPVPFEDIFLPCILVARQRLIVACGDRYGLLSAQAHAAFERFLLKRLSALSSRVFEVAFSTFIACLQLEGISYIAVKADATSRTQYLRFVHTLYAGELALLFQEYGVWARRLAVRIEQWVQLTAEFLTRLQVDLPAIQDVFAEANEPGQVVSVEVGLSDSHEQGRTVVAVTFASGLRVVYKPKDMGMEADYFRLAGWFNEHGAPLPFGVLRVINRGMYGWVEYAGPRPMATEAEARRYFQRAGMLLCLMYIFDGIDFHYENVIACGEYPLPIDLETFFQHRVQYSEDVRALTSASSEVLANSVLRTHFLPNLYRMQGRYVDISGMGAMPGQAEPGRALTWQHINTDAMVFKYEAVTPNAAKNAPRIKNIYLAPDDYIEEIVDGFARLYRMVISTRDILLGMECFFPGMFQNKVRFIFRATNVYAALHQHALHPDYQHEGVDLSLQLDRLSQSFLPAQEKSVMWPLVREEQQALWAMDIPRFTALGTSNSLVLAGGDVVQHCFEGSPCERVKDKMRGLGEKDLARQIELITTAMAARRPFESRRAAPFHDETPASDEVPQLDTEALIQQALVLAEELRVKADYSPQGKPSWISLRVVPGSEQFMLDVTDFSLYEGCSGIAVFLAALERVAPGSGFRDMAYATIALMRRWLTIARPSEIAKLGIGGYVGLGSMVYALVCLGELLDDPILLQESRYAASLIREQDIDADQAYDVLAGSAGTILSLLAGHKRSGDQMMLDTARYCGRHLLTRRMKTSSGFWAWNTIGDTPLLGFSHGAAGIAYALLKLYQASGETEYLTAAQEAIAYETDAFSTENMDWPDLRDMKQTASADGPESMCAWCHGASGIGLARLGGLVVRFVSSL